MTQTDMFELETTTIRAIDMAGAFANPDWYSEAEATVSLLCKIGVPFTTDEVHRILGERGLSTPEPRALGSVMRQAARDKLIVPTGHFRKSIRRECHRRPLAVWAPVNYKRHSEAE